MLLSRLGNILRVAVRPFARLALGRIAVLAQNL